MITGHYGCNCHPFKSWEECEAAHSQHLEIGEEVMQRCTAAQGTVFQHLPERGFVLVSYGDLPKDIQLEHVANLVTLKSLEMENSLIVREKALIDKFDAIEIKSEDLIPKPDISFLSDAETRFRQIYDEHKVNLQKFTELADKEANSYYCGVEKGYRGYDIKETRHSYRNSEEYDEWDRYRFTHNYPIVHTHKLILKLLKYYITECLKYFIEKYQLEIEYDKIEKEDDPEVLEKMASANAILDFIKSNLNGVLDFRGEAVRQAIKLIEEKLSWRSPVLKGRLVEFASFYYSRNDGYMSRHDDGHKILNYMIAVYEQEEVIPDYVTIASVFIGVENTPNKAQLLESFKLFKNNKLQFKFKDPADARAFCNRFNFKPDLK